MKKNLLVLTLLCSSVTALVVLLPSRPSSIATGSANGNKAMVSGVNRSFGAVGNATSERNVSAKESGALGPGGIANPILASPAKVSPLPTAWAGQREASTQTVSDNRNRAVSPPSPLSSGSTRTEVAQLASGSHYKRLYQTLQAIEQAADQGMRMPATLTSDGAERISPQAEIVLDQIETEFIEALQSEIALADEEVNHVVLSELTWEDAQSHADRRYQLFFGSEAYNAKTVRAAQEALGAH